MQMVRLENQAELMETKQHEEMAVDEYLGKAKAERTIQEYRKDWSYFERWCKERGHHPCPARPETVAAYIAHLARSGYKPSTIRRRITSINQVHNLHGYEKPSGHALVRNVWAGIRREHGTAQKGKAPATVEVIRDMVAMLGDGLIGTRDRALLLIGFAGAFRRSELVALDVEDVEETADGLVIFLRRSKTDQEGKGRKIGIPYGSDPATCPVRALRAWLEVSGITTGPIFRPINRHGHMANRRLSGHAVALIVKRCAAAAGYDPSKFAGHSLRAGLATSAAAAGKSERAIMAQTGHKSVMMVRRYIRDGNIFRDNAAAGIGL